MGEDGKWAPAQHLSAVCTERDKAIKEAGELRWAISGTTGQLRIAEEKLALRAGYVQGAVDELENALTMLRTPGVMAFDAEAKFEAAIKLLKELS